MKTFGGKIDENDLEYVVKRFGKPKAALPCPLKGQKINPQASVFWMGGNTFVSVFHVKPVYYEALDETWRPMREVCEHHGNRLIKLKPDWDKKMTLSYLRWLLLRADLIKGQVQIPFPNEWKTIRLGREIFLTTTTVFPDPDPETTTVDGHTARSLAPPGEVFATIRAGAGNDSGPSSTIVNWDLFRATTTSNQYVDMNRGIALFDTSSIPDTDSISAATFSLYSGGSIFNDFGGSSHVVSSGPASNTNIVNSDYDRPGGWGTTSFGSIAYGSISAGAYNDFVLNASGIANISKTGVSKFGGMSSHDFNNTEPTWSSAADDGFQPQMADTAGTTQDPKLVVTHAAAAVGSSNLMSLMGVGT